jgi:hypothetical protein
MPFVNHADHCAATLATYLNMATISVPLKSGLGFVRKNRSAPSTVLNSQNTDPCPRCMRYQLRVRYTRSFCLLTHSEITSTLSTERIPASSEPNDSDRCELLEPFFDRILCRCRGWVQDPEPFLFKSTIIAR